MKRRKSYTYLLAAGMIFLMAILFGRNVFTHYFSSLGSALSILMALGFTVCGIQELSNYFHVRKEEKEEKK